MQKAHADQNFASIRFPKKLCFTSTRWNSTEGSNFSQFTCCPKHTEVPTKRESSKQINKLKTTQTSEMIMQFDLYIPQEGNSRAQTRWESLYTVTNQKFQLDTNYQRLFLDSMTGNVKFNMDFSDRRLFNAASKLPSSSDPKPGATKTNKIRKITQSCCSNLVHLQKSYPEMSSHLGTVNLA